VPREAVVRAFDASCPGHNEPWPKKQEAAAMTAIEEKLVEQIDDAYAMEHNVLRMLGGMIGTTRDPQKRPLEWNKIVDLSLKEEGVRT
jgi:hypothetical protein